MAFYCCHSVIFFVLLFAPVASSGEKIVIAADYWCPYNCEPQSELPGYMVEVTRRAFALHEEDKFKVEYRVLPWSRAILYARRGQIAGIIGAVATEAKGLVLPEKTLGYTRSVFFTNNASPWRYTTPEKLVAEGRRIGTIKDYDYSAEFSKFASEHPERLYVVFGENPLPELVRLLSIGKLDAVIEDPSVFYFMLQALDIPSTKFGQAGETGEPQALYVAFRDESHAQILDAGISRLRQSGELAQILGKYNLSDWAQNQ